MLEKFCYLPFLIEVISYLFLVPDLLAVTFPVWIEVISYLFLVPDLSSAVNQGNPLVSLNVREDRRLTQYMGFPVFQ